MKKVFLAIMTMVVLWWGSVGAVSAGDVTVGADFNSAYVWRGITFNDGLVFQPSLDVGYKGFGINVWGNLDIDDYDNQLDSGDFSEVDFTLSYGFDVKSFSFGLGYIEYLFPGTNGGEGTRELYGTVSASIYKGLYAELGFYYDVEVVGDYYANGKIGYTADVNEKFSFDIGALAGYAGEDWAIANGGGTDGGFHEYIFSATGTYTIIKNLTASVYLNYTGSIDDDVLPDQDVELYGGVGIYFAF